VNVGLRVVEGVGPRRMRAAFRAGVSQHHHIRA
jgi:hypothetical protein